MKYSKASEIMLKKAGQKFTLAQISFDQGLYDSCVSELYYSAFQTVTALILVRGEQISNKHTYVRAWVGKNLGVTGLLAPHLVKMYNRLMDHRIAADYSSEIMFDKAEVEGLMEQVRIFNKHVIRVIETETSG